MLIRSFFYVLGGFLGPQAPSDIAAMSDLVIGCIEKDLAFSQELVGNLPIRVLWLALTVRRKSPPCSLSCRITVAGCEAHLPG